jgi:hypothetical protein
LSFRAKAWNAITPGSDRVAVTFSSAITLKTSS